MLDEQLQLWHLDFFWCGQLGSQSVIHRTLFSSLFWIRYFSCMNLLAGSSWSHRSFWNHLEPPGAVWSHFEPSGAVWTHLESCIWSHLEASGAISRYLDLSGAIWSYLEPPGAFWSHRGHLDPSGAIWSYMESSGAFCSHLKLSGLIWGLSGRMSPYVIVPCDSIWTDPTRCCLMC